MKKFKKLILAILIGLLSAVSSCYDNFVLKQNEGLSISVTNPRIGESRKIDRINQSVFNTSILQTARHGGGYLDTS